MRAVRTAGRLITVLLGVLEAVTYRHAMNPDGVSYLDVARAYLAGDLASAINPYWGPLYSWLLTGPLRAFRPSLREEFALVHAVNFLVLLGVLAAFEFFLSELLRSRRRVVAAGGSLVLGELELTIFAYGVFIYSSLGLIGLALVTPDLCLEATVLVAAGLLLRILDGASRPTVGIYLGVTLGLGYLAKSVMFPVGLGFLAALFVVARREPGWRPPVAPAAAAFLLVAGLWILPISRAAGKPTFGTSGELTYQFVVNGIPWANWQGDSTPSGATPRHPPRRLLTDPDVYEYTAHARGTYPPWFDPTWWSGSDRIRFHPSKQWAQLLRAKDVYRLLFVGWQWRWCHYACDEPASTGLPATIFLLAVWAAADRRRLARQLGAYLPLLLPCAATLALYALVNVESRFVAPFVAVLWIVGAGAAHGARPSTFRGLLPGASLLSAVLLVAPVVVGTTRDAWKDRHTPPGDALVAEELHRLGVRPGDRVGQVGLRHVAQGTSAYWAYLARVQIVAELPDLTSVDCGDSAALSRVLAAFASVGARATVTEARPLGPCRDGWRKVEGTGYYLRLLNSAPPNKLPD